METKRRPAKKVREPVKQGDPFGKGTKAGPTGNRRPFAVRKIKGPAHKARTKLQEKNGFVVVSALGAVDAMRQWFNYHGLTQRTHVFNLQVVAMDPAHPAAKGAIKADHPLTQDELSQTEMMDQAFEDVQKTIGEGPKPVMSMG